VEKSAWQLIEKIDAMGGSVSAIEQGFIQNEIAKSAYEYQRKIETGEKIIVGVNKFQLKEETPIPLLKIDDSIRDAQIQKLRHLKEVRNREQVIHCLETIRQKASGDENIMPAVIDAVENYCTLGEIADELRKLYGEYRR
jgi:methylmalonyl-CoA mutase N-terminal domain/subunit